MHAMGCGSPNITVEPRVLFDRRLTKRQTIQVANEIAMQSSLEAPIRALSGEIVRGCQDAFREGPERIASWIRSNVQYGQESPGIEILQGPFSTIPSTVRVGNFVFSGTGVGDCDDLSILFAALCRASGITAFAVGVADAKDRDDHYFHAMGYTPDGRFYELSLDEPYGGSPKPPETMTQPSPPPHTVCTYYDPLERRFVKIRNEGSSMQPNYRNTIAGSYGMGSSDEGTAALADRWLGNVQEDLSERTGVDVELSVDALLAELPPEAAAKASRAFSQGDAVASGVAAVAGAAGIALSSTAVLGIGIAVGAVLALKEIGVFELISARGRVDNVRDRYYDKLGRVLDLVTPAGHEQARQFAKMMWFQAIPKYTDTEVFWNGRNGRDIRVIGSYADRKPGVGSMSRLERVPWADGTLENKRGLNYASGFGDARKEVDYLERWSSFTGTILALLEGDLDMRTRQRTFIGLMIGALGAEYVARWQEMLPPELRWDPRMLDTRAWHQPGRFHLVDPVFPPGPSGGGAGVLLVAAAAAALMLGG